MMLKGQEAIDFLSDRVNYSETEASSHWQKYHQSYSFTGNEFHGLQGFGGYSARWKNPFNYLLQRPFRKMGNCYPEFSRVDKIAANIAKKQNRAYDLDILRQVITISHLRTFGFLGIMNQSSTCVIGDGFASMTSLLLESGVASTVILVNLTKTLLVDLWFLKLWMGHEIFNNNVVLIDSLEDIDELRYTNKQNLIKVVAVEAKNHFLIQKLKYNLVINIVSMQEMNPTIIDSYFNDIRSAAESGNIYFYCANRVEKILPDGTITRFMDYPWKKNDIIIFDKACPWHEYYYSFRPPFYRNYDGVIWHRLVKIS